MDTIDKIKAEIERRMAEFAERERTAETKQGKVACHHAYAALYDFKYFVNSLVPTKNITAFIARDKEGGLFLHEEKPERDADCWFNRNLNQIGINDSMFKELTWENEPLEVIVSIRKKYE